MKRTTKHATLFADMDLKTPEDALYFRCAWLASYDPQPIGLLHTTHTCSGLTDWTQCTQDYIPALHVT
jgi:hypothetical protein